MNYKKALEFMKYEYNRSLGKHDHSCVHKYQEIALILKEFGYGSEHHVTALFMNILKETDARPAEVLKYCNMQVMEAIRLLQESSNCEEIKRLMRIRMNELAYPVKMAERLYLLRNTGKMDDGERRKLLHETEDYYLKCAHDTIFYEPMFQAWVECRDRSGVY